MHFPLALLLLAVLSTDTSSGEPCPDTALAARVSSEVLFDVASDGACWARGADYKARFSVDGALFIPFLGSDAPRHTPVSFELVAARVGEAQLDLDSRTLPAREEQRVTYDRRALCEHFDLAAAGIQQSFELDELPNRGELRLTLALETELEVRLDGGGVIFEGELGGVRYGAATVFDTRGRSAPAPIELRDGALEIVVTASFLAEASLPILVDPVISTFALDDSPAEDFSPDVAYDASLDLYVVVWQRRFSDNDHDVHGQLLDGTGNIVREFAIDLSQGNMLRPVVAGIDAVDRFLVATREGGSGYTYGRTINLDGVFEIWDSAPLITWNCVNHDLGGDAGASPPYYYCVVAGTDTIYGHAVDWSFINEDGIRVSGGYYGDWDYLNYSPKISKTSREAPGSRRRWGIIWKERMGSHRSIRLGELDPASPYTIHSWVTVTAGFSTMHTQGVSSRLQAGDNNGGHLAVWSTEAGANHVAQGGLIRNGAVQTYIDLGTVSGHDVQRLAVDSDGSSFVVAGSDVGGAGGSGGMFVATWDPLGSMVTRTEYQRLAPEDGATRAPAITSTRSGGGAPQRFFVAWDEVGATRSDIAGALYDTVGPGTRYCTGAPNSVGSGAVIGSLGERSLAANDFHLTATVLPPNQFGMFYLGLIGIELPFGEGFRCIGGDTSRILPPVTSDASGFATARVDFTLPHGGLITAGTPVRYQFWYRDPAGGPSGFNLSDALHIEHLP